VEGLMGAFQEGRGVEARGAHKRGHLAMQGLIGVAEEEETVVGVEEEVVVVAAAEEEEVVVWIRRTRARG